MRHKKGSQGKTREIAMSSDGTTTCGGKKLKHSVIQHRLVSYHFNNLKNLGFFHVQYSGTNILPSNMYKKPMAKRMIFLKYTFTYSTRAYAKNKNL